MWPSVIMWAGYWHSGRWWWWWWGGGGCCWNGSEAAHEAFQCMTPLWRRRDCCWCFCNRTKKQKQTKNEKKKEEKTQYALLWSGSERPLGGTGGALVRECSALHLTAVRWGRLRVSVPAAETTAMRSNHWLCGKWTIALSSLRSPGLWERRTERHWCNTRVAAEQMEQMSSRLHFSLSVLEGKQCHLEVSP